ncbi:MAG TPA: UDP-N-acetylmuramoyl-L-alanine--D-glutamate ligase [Candidatus Paceibacterota bacterium]|nr:UDP-N-acetylmuramoyl-L-alanine--D-glutamate ligase [Candidatus Paceibacterota bacterium]
MDNRGYEACKQWLKGKNVTVMGLGLLGRGVGDVAFFAEHAAHVIVTDVKTEAQLKTSIDQLKQYLNITYRLSGHVVEDFISADIVCKGAGVPLNSPYIEAARNAGKEVVMSSAVFARFAVMSGARIVGVTGTRGKTTAAYLIHHVLKERSIPVRLGGNILGVSTIQFLKDIVFGEVFVLELDSWQLQGFGDWKISPHIAVFTTFLEDHQNYYKDKPQQYLADKANIFLWQDVHDVLILGPQCAGLISETYKRRINGRLVLSKDIPEGNFSLKLIGKHNIYNAAIAQNVLKELGITVEESNEAVASFVGVPGRLEVVSKEKVDSTDKVRVWVNDTTATTPDALFVGITGLIESGHGNIVLIAGGADKELGLGKALEALKMAKVCILLPGTGTNRLKLELATSGLPYVEVSDMHEAVLLAQKTALETGADAVLMSPGFASFGLFKNEYDRGDTFVSEVKKLQHQS